MRPFHLPKEPDLRLVQYASHKTGTEGLDFIMSKDWHTDDVSLYFGDCLNRMAELSDGSIDMVLTDPPYGTTNCKWDSVIPLESMWEQLLRITKKSGVIAMTASQPFSSALVMSNPNMFRHEWVWIKNRGSNFANTVREPMKEHEVVLIFSNGKWTYNKNAVQNWRRIRPCSI